ncbi:MAG: hypothetical protein ABJA90_01260 [Ginsengibacter sp.]
MKSKKTTQKKLTPREFTNKHIANPAHKITDEDFENLKIGPDADADIEKKEKEKLKEIKKEKGGNSPNAYLILD